MGEVDSMRDKRLKAKEKKQYEKEGSKCYQNSHIILPK